MVVEDEMVVASVVGTVAEVTVGSMAGVAGGESAAVEVRGRPAGRGLDTLLVASLTLKSIRLSIQLAKMLAVMVLRDSNQTYQRGHVAAKLTSHGSIQRG